MLPVDFIGVSLIIAGILLLAATEFVLLYRPDIQLTGSVFGIFFTIVGIRLQFTDQMFSALPSGIDIVGALATQAFLGLVIFLSVHVIMRRVKTAYTNRYNPPFPNR